MIEVVYLNRNNPNTIEASEDDQLVDFSAASRMVVEFDGVSVVADSDANASLFDWSAGNGLVEFNFNSLAVPAGLYSATLIVYDGAHPNGQVLVHIRDKRLQFRFV